MSLDRGFRMHRISTRQDARCAGGFEVLFRGPQRRLRFQASNGLARVWTKGNPVSDTGSLRGKVNIFKIRLLGLSVSNLARDFLDGVKLVAGRTDDTLFEG
jgi:hypothetical protein